MHALKTRLALTLASATTLFALLLGISFFVFFLPLLLALSVIGLIRSHKKNRATSPGDY